MLTQLREQRERRFGKICLDEAASLRKLNSILSKLSSKYGMDIDKILGLVKKRAEYASIPAALFNNPLSPLENVVLYMYIKLGFSQSRIAALLQRDHTTIWTTLDNALKKTDRRRYRAMIAKLDKGQMAVPLNIFSDRKLSILENLCTYIKEKYNLTYHDISVLLGKDDRTIWTVVSRARKKLAKYYSIVKNRNV